MVSVRWLGVAGLELTYKGKTLLIDPYLSRPSKLDHLFSTLNPDLDSINSYLKTVPGKIQGILLGHTHSDHVLDVPDMVKITGTKAYGTKSLANLFSAYGIEDKAVVVEPGKPIKLGPFEVTPFASCHGRAILGKIPFPGEIERGLTPPLKMFKYKHGGPLVWRIKVGRKTFIQLGSADFIEENVQGVTCDVLFPCAAGRQYTPNFTERMLKSFQPKTVIPFHFDDFFRPLKAGNPFKHVVNVKVEQFVTEIRDSSLDIEVLLPEPFAQMEF